MNECMLFISHILNRPLHTPNSARLCVTYKAVASHLLERPISMPTKSHTLASRILCESILSGGLRALVKRETHRMQSKEMRKRHITLTHSLTPSIAAHMMGAVRLSPTTRISDGM